MKETLNVIGMTCASCAKAVERIVGRLEGVTNANVNLATEKLLVEFDNTQIDVERIKQAIIEAGFDVAEQEDSVIREVTIPLGGMSCASCVQSVDRTLTNLPGIQRVSVNLATEKATISYDTSVLRIAEIKDAIIKAG